MIYAGFWKRAAALAIDFLILMIPAAILGSALPVAGGFLVYFLYRPFFEASELMGTPGKLFMGLQVTTESGARLTFSQALTRSLLTLVSCAFSCLGYALNLVTKKRQTFHDLIAQTVVIETNVKTENIDWFNVWWGEVKKVFNIPPSETSAPSKSAYAEDLEALHGLFQRGVLSEEEYAKKKAEILSRI